MGKRAHIAVVGTGDAPAVDLFSIANVAAEGDNCAVAARDLEAGTAFVLPWAGADAVYTLSHKLLEGHRFAIQPVKKGDLLLSWGLKFGYAEKDLGIGEYIMNALMLEALNGRREVTWPLPAINFKDPQSSLDAAVVLDRSTFVPGTSNAGTGTSPLGFLGYARPDGSAGTRNCVVLLSITSHSARFARAMEKELGKTGYSKGALATAYPNVDGVLSVAHNEGGAHVLQNNKQHILTVLANFIRHPNVGGAVILASPTDVNVTKEDVAAELKRLHGMDVDTRETDGVCADNHCFLQLTDNWEDDVQRCSGKVAQVVSRANGTPRTPQNLSKLRIALQCGGSDSFSGITGNPLAGEVAAEVVRCGGSAVLAETPELVGAEPYILDNCASADVAGSFLDTISDYMRYAARHGQDAAGNPSGGNLFRGLYNILLKSLGASRKKPPTTTLDGVLAYGERVPADKPGYYFMDSPGNDLESIAGQVATGCNLIYFVTGNGAITNFPFVPTLKFVTTTRRFQKLERDMDVNAGELNDGVTMKEGLARCLDLSLKVSSGHPCKGEAADHSQVHIWRNHGNAEGQTLEQLEAAHANSNVLVQKALKGSGLDVREEAMDVLTLDDGVAWGPTGAKKVNLVLPTSLCSSQIARLTAARLNEKYPEHAYCSVPHTEGCGGGGGVALDAIISRVLSGHLLHPLVQSAFVMEHGCEKTHNDWFLAQIGKDKEGDYGWGSVQGDGGIENVSSCVEKYFNASAQVCTKMPPIVLGLLCREESLSDEEAVLLANLCLTVIKLGGSVIVPAASSSAGGVLRSKTFISETLRDDMPGEALPATLAFAERIEDNTGFHIMECQDVMSCKEVMTGVAACGATALLWWVGAGTPLQAGHPFVPTLHASTVSKGTRDMLLDGAEEGSTKSILDRFYSALTGSYVTKCSQHGSVDFSIPRGVTSISL